jgi:Protein of unknown function DUF262
MTASSESPGAEIIDAVDERVNLVRTKSLDISFNELLDMYRDEELIIDPAYQRLFRWSEGAQSRFIESLVLEMPVPPIFLIERQDNVYELIDGLQRISSYLHFRGALTEIEGQPVKPLRLQDCDIVMELNGLLYDELPKPLEIKLKRNFIRAEVLRKESDPRLRYYMFKRLNTGGALLSEQEIRNCTIRLLDNEFNEFVARLSTNAAFRTCISLIGDERLSQRYDQELVLRFFALKNDRESYQHEVGEFLTEYMEKVADPTVDIQFDYSKEEELFRRVFGLLAATLGEDSFSVVDIRGTFRKQFSVYHYEAIVLALPEYIDQIDPDDRKQVAAFERALRRAKADRRFHQLIAGGGKNYPVPLRDRVNFMKERLGTLVEQ